MNPATMRAVVLTDLGSVDHLQQQALPIPDLQTAEVLIRVHTVAANHRDLFTIAGSPRPPTMPHVLGIDPAGVVVAAGPGVDAPAVGDRVVVKPAVACGACRACDAGREDACKRKETIGVTRAGGFAEYVAVPARNAFVLPDRLDFCEASALAHSVPVALQTLRRASVGAGDVVLVSSAAGAIGSGAVQLTKALGARVIAAARGAEKLRLVAGLGADLVIDYEATPDFADTVRRAYPDGASVYVDSAGDPAVWTEAFKTLGEHGRAVVCGSHGGPIAPVDLNRLYRLRLSILGSSGSTRADVEEVLRLAAAGAVRPPVDSVRPLADVRSGFERLMRRENRGKVILKISA